MINSNTPFLNELNVAVVDVLLSLSDHLGSGMISSYSNIEKDYQIVDSNIKIKCDGGVDKDGAFLTMSAYKLNTQDEYEDIIDYQLAVRTASNNEGGFGRLIREEMNRLFNKEKSVPDYVVEALNTGYSSLLANNGF